MTKCSHGKGPEGWDNVITKEMLIAGEQRSVRVEICWRCSEWLSLGPANDKPSAVKIEIRAARLIASFTTGDDTDDDLDDPVLGKVFAAWCGLGRTPRAAEPSLYLYEQAIGPAAMDDQK